MIGENYMKLHFFGTCAGSSPKPNRKHTSFAIEKDGELYWFDAGEGCSYTAHLMGLNLLSVHNIFISHTHMDHVGGLANLIWTILKLDWRLEKLGVIREKALKKIDVFIPNMETWEGVVKILGMTEDRNKRGYDIRARDIQDGGLYNQKGFKVTALHNTHIPRKEGEPWRSFSFLIEAEGKKIVYSGDVGSIRDIDPLIKSCDLLLMENGHHKVEDVCYHIKDNDLDVRMLGFIHVGGDIIRNKELELHKARAILGDRVFITEDGMTMEI